jgi:hypothetical protein
MQKNISGINSFKVLICVLAIALGNSATGYFIGRAIERFKSHDRFVVVKGLSEREVKADLAVWQITFKNTGDDLSLLQKKSFQDKELILLFLKQHNLADNLADGNLKVIDKWAQEYGQKEDKSNRYLIESTVMVRTPKVIEVAKAREEISSLIEKAVIVSENPSYYYSKFSEIKPLMIAEATKNARQAALQFAQDSDSKVGAIRSATQGSFSINSRDSFGDANYSNEAGSIEKKIRVVSTVTFSLQ